MHRPRHRADRDGHLHRHHRRDGRGSRRLHRHREDRQREHRHQYRHHRGNYRRRHHRDDRHHRDEDRRRDGGRHRDAAGADPWIRATDAAACCSGRRHRDGEPRDAAPADEAPGAQSAEPRRTGCCRHAAPEELRAWGRVSHPDEGPVRVSVRPRVPLPRAAPRGSAWGREPLPAWERVRARVRPQAPARGAPRQPVPQPSSAPASGRPAWDRPSWGQLPSLRPRHWTRRERTCRRQMIHEDAARRGLPPSTTRT